MDPPGGVRGCPLLCCRRRCAGMRGRRGGGRGGPAVRPGGAQSPVPGRGTSCVGSRWGGARGCSAPHRSTVRCPSGRHPANRPVEMEGGGVGVRLGGTATTSHSHPGVSRSPQHCCPMSTPLRWPLPLSPQPHSAAPPPQTHTHLSPSPDTPGCSTSPSCLPFHTFHAHL